MITMHKDLMRAAVVTYLEQDEQNSPGNALGQNHPDNGYEDARRPPHGQVLHEAHEQQQRSRSSHHPPSLPVRSDHHVAALLVVFTNEYGKVVDCSSFRNRFSEAEPK